MIVRLRTMEFLNLRHATHGDLAPDGGMRVYILQAQPRDLPPDDADRLRRRLVELDPEPMSGGPAALPPPSPGPEPSGPGPPVPPVPPGPLPVSGASVVDNVPRARRRRGNL